MKLIENSKLGHTKSNTRRFPTCFLSFLNIDTNSSHWRGKDTVKKCFGKSKLSTATVFEIHPSAS